MAKGDSKYDPKISSKQKADILRQPRVEAHLQQLANKGAEIATGQGSNPDVKFKGIVRRGGTRSRGYIAPDSVEAIIDDAENSILLKTQSAMRGS